MVSLTRTACIDFAPEAQPAPGDPTTVNAQIEVSPALLDFQHINPGESLLLPVTITSIGRDTLYLENLFVEGADSFSLDDTTTDRILAPGSQTTLPITYTPIASGDQDGQLHIISNDWDDPEVTVTLKASGLLPSIELSPTSLDFGNHEIGCVAERTITITNAGPAPLILSGVVFEPTSEELTHEFHVAEGTVMSPGQTETVTVYYYPLDELPDTGYLYVHSNDPARPEARAAFYAQAHLSEVIADEYTQLGSNRTDILWVVDNSDSMAATQDSLAIHFADFLGIAEMLGIDFQMGVVTTDDSTLQGLVPIMTPSTPDLNGVFMDAVTVGTTGAGDGQGLWNGFAALSPPMTDPGGPNEGFLREDASLRVIFVSDGADLSQGTVADYVLNYAALKVNLDHVVLNAIVDLNNGSRYEQAATMTGGLVDYLGNPAWVNTLSDLAWASVSWQDTFELSQVPVTQTIGVEINHVPVHEGWHLNDIYNAVVFEPGYVPDTGDLVTIRYSLLGTCCE